MQPFVIQEKLIFDRRYPSQRQRHCQGKCVAKHAPTSASQQFVRDEFPTPGEGIKEGNRAGVW
jgi:hypothetical protein